MAGRATPDATGLGIGFVTNFFDTLGIGSFATQPQPSTGFSGSSATRTSPAPSTSAIRWPTVFQALIYVTIVEVDFRTLVLLILAAVVGSWLGASVVAGWPRRNIQVGMGAALLSPLG